MVKLNLVFLIALIFSISAHSAEKFYSKTYLGEKNLSNYFERFYPAIFHSVYDGKLYFKDDLLFKNILDPYLWDQENQFRSFLGPELSSGMSCPNDDLIKKLDEMRYAYRLITLSYLIEGQWHLSLLSTHFKLKKSCDFNIQKWARDCQPKTNEMKTFIERLIKYNPKYEEEFHPKYTKEEWLSEFSKRNYKWYSHYRLKKQSAPLDSLSDICHENQKFMTLLCSEEDELYGISSRPFAYALIGQSNIINTFNKEGNALSCLRRFSQVFSRKEVVYPVLEDLFPIQQSFLKNRYDERFLQGRVFFYGAGKEFDDKGLKEVYVMANNANEAAPKIVESKAAPKKIEQKKIETSNHSPQPVRKEIVEIKKIVKSAFQEAAEARAAQDLKKVEVDMLKFKYDFVFSLNLLNELAQKLEVFMTRDALTEMHTYDHLGSKEAPVPLLFIKYMIDMQEHQGLWNVVSVLGSKFYVVNEIDSHLKPAPEKILLLNDESTAHQWQIFILKP